MPSQTTFCTSINCMDGRVQLPVIEYLEKRFRVDYVDEISEAGPVRYLAEEPDSFETRSIMRRVDVSLDGHGSRAIALAAHHDCAGNPVEETRQREQLQVGLRLLQERYPRAEVLGLWVDADWKVSEVAPEAVGATPR
jgi:hypothetical protein